MRISDWSSDVCSSDLAGSSCDLLPAGRLGAGLRQLPAQFVTHLIGGTNAARLHFLKPACHRHVQYPAQQLVSQIAVRLHLAEVPDDHEHRRETTQELATTHKLQTPTQQKTSIRGT